MANKRIRALTEVTSMGDTDVVAIDNTTLSEAKKITKANLLTETTAAIALKEDSANKTTDLSVSNDILFPTTEAVNEGLDLKLNKDFIPFTEETVVVGTDVVPINTGASVLKKMTFDTAKTWIIETATSVLDTIAQTVKGAINELKGDLGDLQTDVGDVTTLDTTSKEVVGAINEVNTAKMAIATYDPNAVGADAFDSANHAYDNATSGLIATNVQDAIDEVDGMVDDIKTNIDTVETNLNGVATRVSVAEQRITDLEEIATSTIYGCVWDKTPTSTGTRIGACKNFVANIGIDDQLVINDFDSAPIFGELKEVTDTLGNVFIRIPKFYIRKRSETGWLSKEVSKYQYDGFYLPKCFWDFENEVELDYCYFGKCNAGLNATKLTSVVGVNPLVLTNIVNLRTYAENNNAGGLLGYQQLDIHAYDALVTLMQIEFATLDMGSVMRGFTEGQYLATHTLTADTNPAGYALVVSNATGALYRVGQSIGVGTTLGGNQRFYGRVITQIDVDAPVAGSTTITFDGDAVALTTGDILYNVGWRSGFSYDIAASSGCIVANDGKYPCSYRGIENPYGNVWQWVDGVNITARQAWVCDDADDYASNLFSAPYKQLSYVNASTNNYVKEMGFDANNPFAEFPVSVDVVGNSPYKDYYYQNTADYVARVGGRWNSTSDAGPSYWVLIDTSSNASVIIGGRLLKKDL